MQGKIATLTGTVDVLDTKLNAEKKAEHVKGVDGIRNQIQVAGPAISDAELQDKLVKAISYDRVGYGTTAFNSISVAVQNGVVTLGGYAYGPTDAASAASVVAYTKGVKDMIDEITVNPPSPMDDRIPPCHLSRGLRLPVAEQVRYRPGQANPHSGFQRPRGALRHGGLAGG